jgi:hypothetical protein
MYVTNHEPIKPTALSHLHAGESRAVVREDATTNGAHAEAIRLTHDTVELSTAVRDVQRVEHVLRDSPEIREHRVFSATQAVMSGTLNLHGKDLASSLLADPLHTVMVSV